MSTRPVNYPATPELDKMSAAKERLGTKMLKEPADEL